MDRHARGSAQQTQATDPGRDGGPPWPAPPAHPGVADQGRGFVTVFCDQLGQPVGDRVDRWQGGKARDRPWPGRSTASTFQPWNARYRPWSVQTRMVHAGAVDEDDGRRTAAAAVPVVGDEEQGRPRLRPSALASQRAIEIGGDVARVLEAHREADHVVAQAHGGELLGTQLQVGGEAGWITRVLASPTLARCESEAAGLDEAGTRRPPALHAEADDRPGPARQQALRQRMIGVLGPGRMDDVGYRRLPAQEVEHGCGVGDVALHAQRQGLHAEQQIERVLRAETGTEIAQALGPGAGEKAAGPKSSA